MKDIEFYNQESRKYSSKRYPERTENYVQFFFKKRLEILLREMERRVSGREGLSLLEVGCADGVVLRAAARQLSAAFRSLVGIDTAPEMIKAAKESTSDARISYFERGSELESAYDVVIEIGVANYADFDEELDHARKSLREGGFFALSIAGTDSLNARFGQGVGYRNFLSYAEYESKISTRFEIQRTIPVGLYVPLIWRIPFLARATQPLLEAVLRPIAPDLFHEKLYFLSLR